VTGRRRGALVEVRCPACGHLLASLYRGRGGELRIQYAPGALTGRGQRASRITDKAAALIPGGTALWLGCCRRGRLEVLAEDLTAAAGRAAVTGRTVTIPAVPAAGTATMWNPHPAG